MMSLFDDNLFQHKRGLLIPTLVSSAEIAILQITLSERSLMYSRKSLGTRMVSAKVTSIEKTSAGYVSMTSQGFKKGKN